MSKYPFLERLRFAGNGLRSAFRSERNIHIQLTLGSGAIALLFYFRPEPIWWGLFTLIIGAVLAAEVFNTAIERLADALHPAQHPLVGMAKDCAAAAVLILSVASLFILAAFLVHVTR